MPVMPDIASKKPFTPSKLGLAIEQRKKNDLTDKLVHARFCFFALVRLGKGESFDYFSALDASFWKHRNNSEKLPRARAWEESDASAPRALRKPSRACTCFYFIAFSRTVLDALLAYTLDALIA